jgi:hypothetical protein
MYLKKSVCRILRHVFHEHTYPSDDTSSSHHRHRIEGMSSKAMATEPTGEPQRVVIITPINTQGAQLKIRGTAPYVQHAFSEKTRLILEARHREGSKGRNTSTKKEPRDFEADYQNAAHKSVAGWHGIPAAAFRNAAISACRVAGFVMTKAKLSIFVIAEGYDSRGTPLVRIFGEPQVHESTVRNESGVIDIRWRPMWMQWHAVLHMEWDGDQFGPGDIFNLMARAGKQVGIGEGRAESRDSNGLGWGSFEPRLRLRTAASPFPASHRRPGQDRRARN